MSRARLRGKRERVSGKYSDGARIGARMRAREGMYVHNGTPLTYESVLISQRSCKYLDRQTSIPIPIQRPQPFEGVSSWKQMDISRIAIPTDSPLTQTKNEGRIGRVSRGPRRAG